MNRQQPLLLTNFESYRGQILKSVLNELGFQDIEDFQSKRKITVDGMFGLGSFAELYELMLNPTEIGFSGNFFPQFFHKNQIVLHHSASADNIANMYHWWRVDGVSHVATHIGIDDNGNVGRGYNEDFWAHHIGMRDWRNLALNQKSVAVEIMNWGFLTKKGDKFYNYVNREIPREKVISLNFRGQKFFELYTEKEIETLSKWIKLMSIRYDIPIDYREKDLWEVSENAKNSVPGMFTHCSFIADKADIVPQPLMVNMLKNLEPKGLDLGKYPRRTIKF